MYDFLRQAPLFANLADDDLEALAQQMQLVTLEPGEQLFAEGAPGNEAYIIRKGALEIIKRAGGQDILLAVRPPGEMIGEMALLEEAPRMASVRARGETQLIAVEKKVFDELLASSPLAARALLQTVLGRLRNTESQLRQGEKMAQLGKLSAGMAHELNNPAAAVKRGAAQLRQCIENYGYASAALSRAGIDPAGLPAAAPGVTLDALARSDLEMDIEMWLEDQGFIDPWAIAGGLVEAGYDVERLEQLQGEYEAEGLAAVLDYVVAANNAQSLLAEIGQGATRISNIVGALKSYSYLDQAPVQEIDIHEALASTLAVLGPRLQQGIEIVQEFAVDLPPIQGYGSELNQVWTHLIDNAAYAVGEAGTITLRTRRELDWVVVEVEDDGPGIPESIQGRIFEAFFTTKPPGAGTGLGLNTSYNIVVYKHNGAIDLHSRPGMTRFTVWLPLDFENAGPLPAGQERNGS